MNHLLELEQIVQADTTGLPYIVEEFLRGEGQRYIALSWTAMT